VITAAVGCTEAAGTSKRRDCDGWCCVTIDIKFPRLYLPLSKLTRSRDAHVQSPHLLARTLLPERAHRHWMAGSRAETRPVRVSEKRRFSLVTWGAVASNPSALLPPNGLE
jgi:hypothetical protein